MSKVRGAALVLVVALLMGIAPSVAAPAVTLTISPKWITAERFAAEGVSLHVSGLEPGESLYPRYEDGEAPSLEAGSDGTATGTLHGSESLEPGDYRVWVEDLDYQEVASVQLRVTVLDVEAEGTTIVGTGFEPGRPVTLVVNDAERTGTPNGEGRVVFDSTWSGSHDVTLSSAAGEITKALTLTKPKPKPTPSPTPSLPSGFLTPIMQDGQTLIDQMRAAGLIDPPQTPGADIYPSDRPAPPLPPGFADQMDRMLDRQRELLGTQEAAAANLQSVLDRIEAARQAQIQLNLDAQQRAAEAAAAAYEQAMRDRGDEEALERFESASQMRDRLRELQEKTRQERASLIAVMRSEPQALGRVRVAADGTVSVPLPDDASGDHHVALIDPDSGLIVAWVPVSLEARGAGLPRVGAAVAPELLALGAVLALGGAVAWSVSSSRRRVRS